MKYSSSVLAEGRDCCGGNGRWIDGCSVYDDQTPSGRIASTKSVFTARAGWTVSAVFIFLLCWVIAPYSVYWSSDYGTGVEIECDWFDARGRF